MDPFQAAEQLYLDIAASKGAVNVSAWPDGTSYILKVWVAPGANTPKLPPTYDGYRVLVEPTPKIQASAYFA
ncbi:hypothetical protein [Herbaspirillum frisingense]|uniref:hypothetical protein n=1 Tax=Herbaspirillum frisingense TaxID=92645 RepID=UPI0039B1151F